MSWNVYQVLAGEDEDARWKGRWPHCAEDFLADGGQFGPRYVAVGLEHVRAA